MARLEGWESRLLTVIAHARHEPYVLGRHDCFRVACHAVQALTGVDHWPAWAGTYATEREALRRIAEYGGDFDGAFTKLFGGDPVPVESARRGDIVKYVDVQPHLGVVIGRTAAVLGVGGLAYVPVVRCAHAWRIG